MPIRLRCPDCQALMQVADEAAGQRTRCPGCSKIVTVPQSGSAPVPPKPPSTQPPQQTPSKLPSASAGPRPAAPGQPSPQRASAQRPAPPIGSIPAGRPVSSGSAEPRQVRCPKCQQTMRAAAGATVQCPHCGTRVKIPGPGRVTAPAAAPASNPLDDLFTSPPPPAPVSYNPYTYGGAPAAGGGFSRPASRSSGDSRTWQYVVNGVMFLLLGGLMLLGVVANLAVIAMAMINGAIPDNQMPLVLARGAGQLVIALPLGITYLMGGTALVQRRSLSYARSIAVLGCIPCLNGCLWTPFGIWTAVLVFSEQAKRDFKE